MEGRFSDLPLALRERVFARVRELFRIATPSATPEGSTTHSVALGYQADAFEAALRWGDADWLDANVVRTWLPALLFSLSSERTAITSRCYQAAADAAVAAVVEELRRDSRRRDHPSVAASLPEALWGEDRVHEAVRGIVRHAASPPDHRGALLRLWSERVASHPRRRAEVLAVAQEQVERGSELALAAIDVMTAPDPARGVATLRERARTMSELATALQSLIWPSRNAAERINRWPDEALSSLASILCASGEVPWEHRDEVSFVGDEDRLRDPRDAALDQLARRQTVDVEDVVALLPDGRRAKSAPPFCP